MPSTEVGTAASSPLGYSYQGANNSHLLWIDSSGAQVVMDFYLKAALDGRAFQVRAGTITTPLVGDVVITDTAAEFCVDPAAGLTIMPVQQFVSVRLGTGTLHEYAVKSVAAASSAGAAFVPLLLKPTGAASACTARVAAAGGVTVTAELATTTRRHWSWSNPAAFSTGALPSDYHHEWVPKMPPILSSTAGTAQCLYTQIAATGTGPSYYANLDWIEFATNLLQNPS